jgi:O-antigen ligase
MLVLGLPLTAVALVTRHVYVACVPDLLPPWAALALGVALGAVAVVVFVAGQGTTVVEIVVPSLMLVVLLLILWPNPEQMKRKRRINIMKREMREQQKRLKPSAVNAPAPLR